MFYHTQNLQFEAKPDAPDPAFARRFQEVLGGMDLVTREEFEVVKEMAATARTEADALRARLDALEGHNLPTAAKPKKAPATTSAKTSSKTKKSVNTAEK